MLRKDWIKRIKQSSQDGLRLVGLSSGRTKIGAISYCNWLRLRLEKNLSKVGGSHFEN